MGMCSPTATPWGPAWAASGVDIALCDLIGKVLGTPAYTLLGGSFAIRLEFTLIAVRPTMSRTLGFWWTMARRRLRSVSPR